VKAVLVAKGACYAVYALSLRQRTWWKYEEHGQTTSKRGGVFLFGGTLLAEDGVIELPSVGL